MLKLFSFLLTCFPMLIFAQMSVNISYTPPCNNDGTITATVIGGVPPYTYQWHHNGGYAPVNYCVNMPFFPYPNSPTLTGLHNRGQYNWFGLKVTDANGNQAYGQYTNISPNFSINPVVTAANCPASDGSVSIQVVGGTPPYSYSWMNGNTTNSITGLGFGDTYDVTVIDANGCRIRLAELDSTCALPTMVSISNIQINIDTTTANCLNGTATANILSGGTAPFAYSWSNGQTSQTATNLEANYYYQVQVTDANGCTQSQGIYMLSPVTITATISTTDANCLDGTAIISNVAGGAAPYTFSWSNGQSNDTITNLTAFQYYSVIVTDANACKKTFNAYINSNSTLQVTTAATPETCYEGNGTATLIAVGGVQPYSYSWSSGTTTMTADSLSSGNYLGTVTDANGCAKSQYAYITQYNPIAANPTITGSACNAPTGSITLNPTGGTSPYTYYWNTSPPQVTATAINLAMGTYYYMIGDSAGCLKQGFLNVGDNSTLTISLTSSPNVCFNGNGVVQANITGGVLPYSYTWSNGASNNNQTGLNAGTYWLTATDSTGCIRKDTILVTNFSPVNLSFSTNNASCIYVNDGSATVFASGGTPPYTYQWANGSTTQTINNLLPNHYYVTVTDAVGCSKSAYQTVAYNTINGCTVAISGKVFQDYNQDCMQVWGEPNLYNIPVFCSNGEYDYTDINGNFSFDGLAPGNYVIGQGNTGYNVQLCPAGAINVSLPVAGMASNNHIFADSFYVVKDLTVNIYNTPYAPVTGNPYCQTLVVKNDGSVAQNPVLTYVHDANIDFMSANQMPTSYNPVTHTLTWNLGSLAPFHTYQPIKVYYQVPPTTVYGTVLAFTAAIAPTLNDITIQNNYKAFSTVVLSAYDPNYIEVFPKGEGVLGLIEHEDSVLEYVVHFQNTGTWAAKTVEIRQMIDGNFRINSIEPIAASHYFETRIKPNKELIFTFPEIYLPDSTSNEPESHGFVAYKVHLNKNLPFGTELTAKADIYFDYNEPVRTNEVLNTIKSPTLPNTYDYIIYPNPVIDEFTIKIEDASNELISIEIINQIGETVYQAPALLENGKVSFSLKYAALTYGLYFVRLHTQREVVTQKLFIVK